MEVHSDFVGPATPALSYNNVSLWRTEDSGYHTSFTPGSVERSQKSDENLEPSAIRGNHCITGHIKVNYDITPEPSFHLGRKYRSKNVRYSSHSESPTESPSPIRRRGVKRSHQEDASEVSYSSIPTPTSMIASGIQQLRVTDNMTFSISTVSSEECSYNVASNLYHLNEYTNTLSYPTTPVKKICRTSCMLSPMKASPKKLNFTIHSLSCEVHGLQQNHTAAVKLKETPTAERVQIKPNQKVDIISLLVDRAQAIPPFAKIFSYLSNEDIHNYSTVSRMGTRIWDYLSKDMKEQHDKYMKRKRENRENKMKVPSPYVGATMEMRALKEVHNILNTCVVTSSPRSPPGTPRTNKFKKYAKAALMDSRSQLSCVRCYQPAKVTVEAQGEEWVECTSTSCSYQFCRFCNCYRHPGKRCFQYDLNGPSPSKRKKTTCAIGTKKSRRNLRRLL